MHIDYAQVKQNIDNAIDDLLSNDKDICKINGDDKFYLKRRKDRIEIRSNESKTWLAYVMYKDISPVRVKIRLRNKYLNLAYLSNPKHFEWANAS
ncbi:MAG: hypothetical protein J6U54_12075 [Clostridiales bacterium]|nr:hypothetical protein [Clostridiales bacterium]